MRCAFPVTIVLLAACTQQIKAPETVKLPSTGNAITVRLSNFSFTPDHLVLHAGQPVTLHLLNESHGGHDFSAPTLFDASAFPAGTVAPTGGVIEVPGGEAQDISFTPEKPGSYPFECTHFLHSVFGMTGTAEVVP